MFKNREIWQIMSGRKGMINILKEEKKRGKDTRMTIKLDNVCTQGSEEEKL